MSSPSRESKKSEKSQYTKWMYLILFVAAIILIIGLVARPNLTKPLLDRRGWLGETYFYDGDQGHVALSVAYHITESTSTARTGSRTERTAYSWIVSIDLTDGSRLARAEFENRSDFQEVDPVRFLGHTDSFIWTINNGDGLHGRDPYSGEIVLTQAEIEEANPEISFPLFYEKIGQSEANLSNYAYDTVGQGILVEVTDNNHILIDPDTLKARSSSVGEIEPRIGIRRAWLVKDTGEYKLFREALYYSAGVYPVRLNPEWSVYDGLFVVDEITDDYLRDSSPDSFFITYAEDYSEEAREFFARVRNDGFPIWATDLGVPAELAAIRNGEIFAIAGGELYKIDSGDGSIAWVYRGSGDPAETDDLATPVAFTDLPAFRQPEPPVEMLADELFPGQVLLADYQRQGIYYPATIISRESDETFEVVYLDGSSETVVIDALAPDDLVPGAEIEVLLSGDWLGSTVIRRNGIGIGIELTEGSLSWVSLILLRRSPEWGRIERIEGEVSSAPLNLVRYSDSSHYYFGTVAEWNGDTATVLYLDGTWESRVSNDIIDGRVAQGTPIIWADDSDERNGRFLRMLGFAAEVQFDDGGREWVSLAHIRLPR